MKKLLIILFIFQLGFISKARSDEGMWIPILIEKYNIKDMQAKGFKLTAEDIYSINKDCLMNAVVIFGRGCTGEVVSDKGLLLTNHHCGYSAIQKHSSIENDYLTNGFWAMKMGDELPNPSLTVKFLKRMEDVTESVLQNVVAEMTEMDRNKIIKQNVDKLVEEAINGTHYLANIRAFFYGNQYYLFVYEEFIDVRLVGAPPSAIGKFGGDTDNWMWPRHTGDFSIFRIYADKENKPAEYSSENVPYKPKRFLSVSLKPINEGDFTWVMGYPGSTQEYLVSDEIQLIANVRNPNKVKARDIRLEIMNKYMASNDTIRIKYASKNAGVSNSWKRWKGEIVGLKRLNTIEKKKMLESDFENWAKQNNRQEYIGLVAKLADIYKNMEEYTVAYDFWRESILGVEILSFVSDFENIIKLAETDISQDDFKLQAAELSKESDIFFKDYVQTIDKETFNSLIPLYYANVNLKYHPVIKGFSLNKKYSTYIDNLYKKSIFTDEKKLNLILSNASKKEISKLANDPAFVFYKSFANVYVNLVYPVYSSLNNETDKLYRLYIKGLQEMQAEKIFYPDANFTMRVSYGNVAGFSPRDAVQYKFYTTLDGVIEKDNPEIYDYDVPESLKKIYQEKDFGRYAVNGTVPVCFIATNHTTGGNSGSPVLDAEGNLIGLNFDRAWDGIMSDMMFDPERSRNVTLDIRYLLFYIDKVAGAKHLINEMNIIE